MRRGVLLLSRVGTVLIAIDLALLLVSILPASPPLIHTWNVPVGPEMFQPAYPIQLVTPQQSLRVKVTIQGTLDVFLLQLNLDTLARGSDEFFCSEFAVLPPIEPSNDSVLPEGYKPITCITRIPSDRSDKRHACPFQSYTNLRQVRGQLRIVGVPRSRG